MGGIIETNDTLQITKEQGFPAELDYKKHLEKPYEAGDFEGQIFEFFDKPKVRIYQLPPIRNFLAENINGQWLYWGLIHVIEERHDMVNQTTSGKFKIVYIYSPEEMKFAQKLIDRSKKNDYLNVM